MPLIRDRPGHRPIWGAEANGDQDCLEGHPGASFLCADQVHLINGGGLWVVQVGSDAGHIGVAGAAEGAAVEDRFVFMAQWDPKPRGRAQVMALCTQADGCSGNGDAVGGLCLAGSCLI